MRSRHVLVVGMVMSAMLAWQVQTDSQATAFDLVIRGDRVPTIWGSITVTKGVTNGSWNPVLCRR